MKIWKRNIHKWMIARVRMITIISDSPSFPHLVPPVTKRLEIPENLPRAGLKQRRRNRVAKLVIDLLARKGLVPAPHPLPQGGSTAVRLFGWLVQGMPAQL
jgi:hypothetical protein